MFHRSTRIGLVLALAAMAWTPLAKAQQDSNYKPVDPQHLRDNLPRYWATGLAFVDGAVAAVRRQPAHGDQDLCEVRNETGRDVLRRHHAGIAPSGSPTGQGFCIHRHGPAARARALLLRQGPSILRGRLLTSNRPWATPLPFRTNWPTSSFPPIHRIGWCWPT